MKSLRESITEQIYESESQNVFEVLGLTALGAALLLAGGIGTTLGISNLTSKARVKREIRKSELAALKRNRLDMYRNDMRKDWDDFFDVAQRLNDDSIKNLIFDEPDLKDAFDRLKADHEIENLRRDLEDAQRERDEMGIKDILKKMVNKLRDKEIDVLNKAASRIDDRRL